LKQRTDLLIVGAGPYGLATAAYAQMRGVDHVLLGEPMEFWWRHMPDDMLLRSGPEWHIDPLDIHTFESYIATSHGSRYSVNPIPVGLFRDYGDWFRRAYHLDAKPGWCESRQSGQDSLSRHGDWRIRGPAQAQS